MPSLFKKKILILLNYVDNPTIFLDGISRYAEKVKDRTNGEFTLELEWIDIGELFRSREIVNASGQTVINVDYNQIEEEAKAEGQFDAICLIFNPDRVIGQRPDHPGCKKNIFQIPTDWVGNIPGWDQSEFSAQLYFAHENCHSDFYLAGQTDKTHNPNPHYQITLTADPTDFYTDLLLELKPYWAKLSTLMIQAEFVHIAGTMEYGILETTPYTRIIHRFTDENDLKFQLKKFGITLALTPESKIDYTKAKDITL